MTEVALLASSLAAIVSRTVMHPMDTLRLRLQVGDQMLTNKSLSLKSINSLYSGFSVAMTFTIPGMALFLTSYDVSKKIIADVAKIPQTDVRNHCLSGFVAQGLAGLVFTPMEVVKGFYQTGANHVKVPTLLSQIYKSQGVPGFFRGYWLSVAVFGPHNVIYFSSYEKIKELISQKFKNGQPLQLHDFIIASSTATLFGCVTTHPIDVIRARYTVLSTQSSAESKAVKVTSATVVRDLLKKEGIKGFYRGLVYRSAYFVPNTALSMTLFEAFKTYFSQPMSV